MSFFIGKDLKVGYGNRVVVDNIDLSLEKGEILCLLGPNGSGKSTIIKSIIDHIKFLGGTLSIIDKDITKLSIKERAKEISVVLTERVAPELMSAREIVSTGRYPHTNHFGKLEEEDIKIINDSIAIVNGHDLEDKEFRSLSDGEKQRIMIARAICQEADIMILDEPTSFLDIRYKIELLNILSKLAIEKNKTIIMSLHEIDLVPKIANKVMLIDKGKVYEYGPPEEVITNEAIKQVYNLQMGSFDTRAGNVELPKNSMGISETFVIGGNGLGTNIYRALNKANINFYTGIIFENDLDYNVAKVLSTDLVKEEAFTEISDEAFEYSKDLIDTCKYIIDSGVDFSGINKRSRELIEYGISQGKVVLSLRRNEADLKMDKYEKIGDIVSRLKS